MSDMIVSGLSESEFIKAAQENTGFTKDETIIPFTRVLQPLSPSVGAAPGAVAGAFFNAGTNQSVDGKTGMIVVPVMSSWNYTEWVDRDSGGGFVRDWGTEESGWQALCDNDQKYAYQPITKDGHVILKARHFFIFQLDELGEIVDQSILPFHGTALKVAKQWSSMMQYAPKIQTSQGMMTPAYFYYTYKLTSEEIKNAKGRWFLPKVAPNVQDNRYVSVLNYPNGKRIWDAAIQFKESFAAGELTVAAQVEEEGDTY